MNERRECLIEKKANNLDYRDLILLIKEVTENDLDISDIFFIYLKMFSNSTTSKQVILILCIEFCLKNNLKVSIQSIIKILNNKRFFMNYSETLPGLFTILSYRFEELKEIENINLNLCKKCLSCKDSIEKELCITNLIG